MKSIRLTSFAFFILCCVATGRAVGEQRCISDSFLEDWSALLTSGDPSKESVRSLLDRLDDYHRPRAECGQWVDVGGERKYQVAEGQYWVWRNGLSDHWFRFEDKQRFTAMTGAVSRLTRDGYRFAYNELDPGYDRSSYFPIVSKGSLTLSFGFADGAAGLQQAEQLARQLQGADQSIAELKERLEKLLQCDENCPEERPDKLKASEQKLRETQARLLNLPELIPIPFPSDLRQPKPDESGEPSQAPQNEAPEGADDNTEAPENGENGDAESSDDGGSSRSEVDGSGGILPAGAPPWLTDLTRMVLAYFGIDQLTEQLMMALYMVAPDLLNDLAEFSASYTKGLSDDDLDKVMAAARELYQLYNGLNNMAANLEASDGFAETLKAVASSIDEMPPSVRAELTAAMGEDLQKLSQLATAAEGVDFDNLGDMFSEENQQLLSQRVQSELRREAKNAINNELVQFAQQSLPLKDEAIARILNGDMESAGKMIYEAAVNEVSEDIAEEIGLEPSEVRRIMSGDDAVVSTIARRRTEQEIERFVDSSGIGDAAEYVSDIESFGALTPEQKRQFIRDKAEEAVPSDIKDSLGKARDALADPTQYVSDSLVRRAKIAPALAQQLASGQPIAEIVAQEMNDTLDSNIGKLDSLTDDHLDKLKSRWAETANITTEEIDRLKSLEGKALRSELIRLGEKEMRRHVETALDIAVASARQQLPDQIIQGFTAGKSTEEVVTDYANHIVDRAKWTLKQAIPPKFALQQELQSLLARIQKMLPEGVDCHPALQENLPAWNDTKNLIEELKARCTVAVSVALLHPEVRDALNVEDLLQKSQTQEALTAIKEITTTAVCLSQSLLPVGANDADACQSGASGTAMLLATRAAEREITRVGDGLGLNKEDVSQLIESGRAGRLDDAVYSTVSPHFANAEALLDGDAAAIRSAAAEALRSLAPEWSESHLQDWTLDRLEDDARQRLAQALQSSGLSADLASNIAAGDIAALQSFVLAKYQQVADGAKKSAELADRLHQTLSDADKRALSIELLTLALDQAGAPWRDFASILASGDSAARTSGQILDLAQAHFGLSVDWRTLPERVERCEQEFAAFVRGDGGPGCTLSDFIDTMAEKTIDDINRSIPDGLLTVDEIKLLYALQFDAFYAAIVERGRCGTIPDCQAISTIAEKQTAIAGALFSRLSSDGGAFQFTEDELLDFHAGGGQRAAQRWSDTASQLIQDAVGDAPSAAQRPADQIRMAVEGLARFDVVPEPDPKSAAASTLTQQRNLEYLELAEAVNDCVTRGLAPPGEGSLDEACLKLARSR